MGVGGRVTKGFSLSQQTGHWGPGLRKSLRVQGSRRAEGGGAEQTGASQVSFSLPCVPHLSLS